MLKNGNEIKWTNESWVSFNIIKKDLIEAHILASLDYNKDFMILSFAYEHMMIVLSLQKNSKVYEQRIALFSKSVRDNELKYNILEMEASSLILSLKEFW